MPWLVSWVVITQNCFDVPYPTKMGLNKIMPWLVIWVVFTQIFFDVQWRPKWPMKRNETCPKTSNLDTSTKTIEKYDKFKNPN